MMKYLYLTAPVLTLGAAALFADAPNAQNGQDTDGGYKFPTREITPEAQPKVTHWADPFITADFIYWKAVVENMHYAYTGAITSTSANAHKGTYHSPDFDFEPGFKLGFGLKFRHDGWDLFAQWTWLSEFEGDNHVHTRTNSQTHSMVHSVLTPQIGLMPDFTYDRGHAEWSMHFNALDIELGRNFFISRYLTLRPHFGFKFGWIDQDYHIKAHNIAAYQPLLTIVNPSVGTAKNDQDFFGCGIRTGLDAVWYFTKHWGLYGDFAISALWSDFHSKTEHHVAADNLAKVENLDFKRTLTTLTQVLELGLGFRYDCTFFLGDYEFYLQAGWEEQIWFNQNQFLDTVDTRTGDLTFQGLTVKAGLMF
ncbi:MAG: hypothetical protein JSR93_07095 [Verrucomicrobia bacterium]|nr:hypothetical protein [Verrucomicrobiota bacterium]